MTFACIHDFLIGRPKFDYKYRATIVDGFPEQPGEVIRLLTLLRCGTIYSLHVSRWVECLLFAVFDGETRPLARAESEVREMIDYDNDGFFAIVNSRRREIKSLITWLEAISDHIREMSKFGNVKKNLHISSSDIDDINVDFLIDDRIILDIRASTVTGHIIGHAHALKIIEDALPTRNEGYQKIVFNLLTGTAVSYNLHKRN